MIKLLVNFIAYNNNNNNDNNVNNSAFISQDRSASDFESFDLRPSVKFDDKNLERDTTSVTGTNVNNISTLTDNFYSTLKVRNTVEPDDIYGEFSNLVSVPKSLYMEYSRILNKPFFVTTVSWSSASTPFSSVATLDFPDSFITNSLALIPFASSLLFRCKACVMFQMAGTPMHQGTLVVAALPYGTSFSSRGKISSVFASPHVFLSANNATSACLEIPFYYNNKLCPTDYSNLSPSTIAIKNNFAKISFVTLNSLVPPTSGSSTITISVHLIFKELEFYVPKPPSVTYSAEAQLQMLDPFFSGVKKVMHDFVDRSVGVFRNYVGLHNRNLPIVEKRQYMVTRNNLNIVDNVTQYEKLDPYHSYQKVVKDYIFHSKQDEMSLAYILSKPYYIDTFVVSNTTAVGTVLFSRPMTPFQESIRVFDLQVITIPMSYMYYFSRFWRGSIKVHIQSSMSNFHFCKLFLCRSYLPTLDALNKYPSYLDLQNSLTETLEFSAGGQIQTVVLPYISTYDQLECTKDWTVNALQHGVYYIYLAQPLVINGSTSSSVSFNVYISAGDDLNFYGYGVHNLQNYTSSGSFPVFEADPQMDETIVPHQVPDQVSLLPSMIDNSNILDDNFRPILSIVDIGRRMYGMPAQVIDPNASGFLGYTYFNIADFIGFTPLAEEAYLTPLQVLGKMFYGFVGGLKFKFKVFGATNVTVKFIPPGLIGRGDPANGFINSGEYNPNPATTFKDDVLAVLLQYSSALPINNFSTFPSVGVEAPNFSSVNAYNIVRAPLDTNNLSASYVIIEGEVPFMNPLSFIGDMTREFPPEDNKKTLSRDLGTLVVSFTPISGPVDPPVFTKVVVEPYVGLSDDARFGFNTISLPSYIPSIRAATGFLQVTPYNNGNNTGFASSSYIINNIAPACYFTKTT